MRIVFDESFRVRLSRRVGQSLVLDLLAGLKDGWNGIRLIP